MTPNEIQQRVLETLWADEELDAGSIRVTVIGRDVWLEGHVPTREMYNLADHIASTVGGVGTLTNNLICDGEPYDIRAQYARDEDELRAEESTDVDAAGRLDSRTGPFGDESDEAIAPEGDEQGGPVGGDDGHPISPMEANEVAPLAVDIFRAEEPWRYGDLGPNAHLEEDAVLPPEEDEV